MKKKVTIFGLLLVSVLISISAFAQKRFTISGQVKDANTKENLIYCHVQVKSNGKMLAGGVTDEKGFFYLDIHPGQHQIILSYIGYVNDTINTYLNKKSFLGVVKLQPIEKSLSEIEVVGSSITAKINRDIHQITPKMTENTTVIGELLEKINGISYNRIDNKIAIDNSSKVIILVDGMEKNTDYVQKLNPKRIKKVEIVRNPGGRYGLQGYTALINIFLDKAYVGHEFFIDEFTMMDLDYDKSNQYFLPINKANLFYNYAYKKWNIYAGLNHDYTMVTVSDSKMMKYDNGDLISEIAPTTNPYNGKMKSNVMRYTLGADYFINPRHTVSFESHIKNFPNDRKTSITHDRFLENTGAYISSSDIKSNVNTSNMQHALFYTGNINQFNKIKSDIVYYQQNRVMKNTIFTNENFYRLENNYMHTQLNFNVAYEHIFNQNLDIKTGYGNRLIQDENNYISTIEVATNEQYEKNMHFFDNFIHQLYAYCSWQTNPKLGMSFGVSGEYSNPKNDTIQHDFFIFQPMLNIQYLASQKANFTLSYNVDNRYPSTAELNTTHRLIDSHIIGYGNVNLNPSLTHKISLKANFLNHKLSIEPYYHFSNNMITQINHFEHDTLYISYDNVGEYHKKGILLSLNMSITQFLSISSTIDFYSSKIDFKQQKYSVKDWTNNTQVYYINPKWKTMFFVQYRHFNSKMIQANGYIKGDTDYCMIGINKQFFNNKLSCLLMYNLPIDLGLDYEQERFIALDNFEKTQTSNLDLMKNFLSVKLTYRLQKGKKVRKIDKELIKEEEKKQGLNGFF